VPGNTLWRHVAGALVIVALAGGACADDPPAPPGPAPTATTGNATSPTPSAGHDETTLRGTVEPGIEAGCLILRADGEVYLLIGDDPALRAGTDVRVRGHIDRDLITTCQQGVPFVVRAVEAN
jgi:hypothetical protein